MTQDASQELKFCLRWKQHVPDGFQHWYLRRLAEDARFWGYVHTRTTTRTEQCSFNGVFPPSVWENAQPLIERIRTSGNLGVTESNSADGLLLEGEAGTGRKLIECNALDQQNSDGANAFFELVGLLQPHVASAASRVDRG